MLHEFHGWTYKEIAERFNEGFDPSRRLTTQRIAAVVLFGREIGMYGFSKARRRFGERGRLQPLRWEERERASFRMRVGEAMTGNGKG